MASQAPQPALFSTAFKIIAGSLTLLGTVATILTTARQEGMIGPLAMVGADVAHIRVTPTSDTAFAVGDTLLFAAIAADTNGVALPSPQLTWSVTNPGVGEARPNGSVIATGPGVTSVVVSAGQTSARATVVVKPRVVELRPASDTVDLPEGGATSLIAMPIDLRGRVIRGMLARWRSSDTTVFAVDSLGLATGVRPGVARASATLETATTELVVRVTPVLGAITIGAGADQHAPATTTLPAPVVIRTLSRQRAPLGGILVRAAVDAGRLESDTATSDGEGNARFRWILGDRPGPQHFVARSDGIDTTLTLTAEADPVAANVEFTLVDSIGAARAGQALSSPITVRLTDTLGQVLPGVPVRWLGMDGSRLVGTAPRTDSLGMATAAWTLGTRVGRNRGRLIAGPGTAVAFGFETNSLAGAPTTIAVMTGDRQRATVASTISARVRVTDAGGNPVAGAALESETTDGSVTFQDQVSLGDGTVRLRWTLGPTAGAQDATLKVGGASIRLTATATPAPASKVEVIAPTITIVSSASVRVVAMVTDSLGNPIRGTVVQPRVSMGSVSPLRATTGADGKATFTWTIARRAGDQTISVRATGVRGEATKTVRRPSR
jgi:hypothetical protein